MSKNKPTRRKSVGCNHIYVAIMQLLQWRATCLSDADILPCRQGKKRSQRRGALELKSSNIAHMVTVACQGPVSENLERGGYGKWMMEEGVTHR